MHTLSSASRTCMASASAVECTATVGIPSSLQVRSTRSAISPRLAMRILSNMSDVGCLSSDGPRHLLYDHQRLPELDGLAVLDQDLNDGSGAGGGDLIHGFHRLDDEKGVAGGDPAADLHKGAGAGLRPRIGGADHGRGDQARMAHRIA